MGPEEFMKFDYLIWAAGWGQETRVWTRGSEESRRLSAPCSYQPTTFILQV